MTEKPKHKEEGLAGGLEENPAAGSPMIGEPSEKPKPEPGFASRPFIRWMRELEVKKRRE